MTPQDKNAAIILSHSRIKKEFVQHSGNTIADLEEMVDRCTPKPITGGEYFRFLNPGRQEEPELCEEEL